MNDPIPPLDPDIRSLLKSGSEQFHPPPGAEARILSSVEVLLSGQFAGPSAPPRGPGASGTVTRVAGTSLARGWPLALSFMVGGALGAGAVLATIHPPPPVVIEHPAQIVYVPQPVEPKENAALVASPPALSASASAKVWPARGPASSLRRPSDQGDLMAERTMLDVARSALERLDGASALAATRDHERRFPTGVLVQEREAMAIRALVVLGRSTEARARLARFRGQFPESVLLPGLESTLRSAPPASVLPTP